jgi:hypothetical protein
LIERAGIHVIQNHVLRTPEALLRLIDSPGEEGTNSQSELVISVILFRKTPGVRLSEMIERQSERVNTAKACIGPSK